MEACLEIQEGDPFQEDVGRAGHLEDPLDLAEVAWGQNPEGREDVQILEARRNQEAL
jgi:hypothetical protein